MSNTRHSVQSSAVGFVTTVCATTTELSGRYLHAQAEPGVIGLVVAVVKALSTGRNLTDCA